MQLIRMFLYDFCLFKMFLVLRKLPFYKFKFSLNLVEEIVYIEYALQFEEEVDDEQRLALKIAL